MIKQNSFLALAAFNKKTLRCEKFLSEMDSVIPWNKLVDLIKPYYTHSEIGRKRKHLTLMLKIHFPRHWYNLSDPEMEDAIYDRNSFQKFLELDMLSETAPDETTILNFRHLLEQHNLQERMFNKVNRLLEEKGLILKKGTIADATIIIAPSSTKNQSKKRDPEMITTAEVHDSQMFDYLLHGKEREVYGDKAYHNSGKAKDFRQRGVKWKVLRKAVRGKSLTEFQEATNKKFSSVRAKVERPFLVVKHLWKFKKTRYRGLFKNGMRLFTSFMLANLYTVRRQLMAA
jgi:IS5 family transposase